MSHLPISGDQPVVPLPEREPAAIRAAAAEISQILRQAETVSARATGPGSTSRTRPTS